MRWEASPFLTWIKTILRRFKVLFRVFSSTTVTLRLKFPRKVEKNHVENQKESVRRAIVQNSRENREENDRVPAKKEPAENAEEDTNWFLNETLASFSYLNYVTLCRN